jgi:7-cyano-7-deazaguanine synthase
MPQGADIPGCRVLVLLSGGIDSAAVVAFYLGQRCEVSGLFVDYGQIAGPKELMAARQVAAYYRIPLRQVACDGVESMGGGLILGRNAFLLFMALMQFDAKTGVIATGIHAGTRYYDCSEPFTKTAGVIFDGYADGRIRIGTPFLTWSKADIWAFCRDRRVPVHMTYSCELGREQPCGECNSCKDLEALDACSKL